MTETENKESIEKCSTKKCPKPWKVFLKAFIISGIITLCTKSYHTIVDTENKVWAEYQSIYDTKDEYFKLNRISRLRCYLAEKGFNETHPIQKFLASYSEKILLQAKAKIPEGDIAIGEFLFMHKYAPLMRSKSAIITEYDKQDLLNFAKHLIEKKSKMESFNKVHRFELTDYIVYWFLFKAEEKTSVGTGEELKYLEEKVAKQIDVEDFVKLRSDAFYMPISVYLNLFSIHIRYFDAFGCNVKICNDIHNDIQRIDQLIKLYDRSNIIEDGKKIFLENKLVYREKKQRIISKLFESCNFKVGKQDEK